MAICFIRFTLISCGDDGFIYLWDKGCVVRRVKGHNASISAINCNPKLGLIVSGCIKGEVNLWRLLVDPKTNMKTLELLKTFTLRKKVEAEIAVKMPEFNV